MVDTAVLERLCTRNGTEGSNPSLSAKTKVGWLYVTPLLFYDGSNSNLENLPCLSKNEVIGNKQQSRQGGASLSALVKTTFLMNVVFGS